MQSRNTRKRIPLPPPAQRPWLAGAALLLSMAVAFSHACGGTSGEEDGTRGSAGSDAGGSNSGGGGATNTAGTMGAGGAPASGTLSIDEFPMVLAQAKCAKLYECCAGMPGVPAMMSTCVAQRNAIHLSWRRAWQPSIMSGKLIWNGDKARACADSLRALACGADTVALAALPCNQLVSPQVAAGGDCAGTHECQMSWCDAMGTGKCEARKANGMSCTGAEQCEGGACTMMMCADAPASMPTTCTIL